jgi:hypothetical protein
MLTNAEQIAAFVALGFISLVLVILIVGAVLRLCRPAKKKKLARRATTLSAGATEESSTSSLARTQEGIN